MADVSVWITRNPIGNVCCVAARTLNKYGAISLLETKSQKLLGQFHVNITSKCMQLIGFSMKYFPICVALLCNSEKTHFVHSLNAGNNFRLGKTFISVCSQSMILISNTDNSRRVCLSGVENDVWHRQAKNRPNDKTCSLMNKKKSKQSEI